MIGPRLLVELIEIKALAQIRAAKLAIKYWNVDDLIKVFSW
jgi:hypothetical protein